MSCKSNFNDGVELLSACLVDACRKDHATAIAHDLEDALWEEVEVVRRGRTVKEWRAKDLSAAELTEIITAVKAR